MLLPDLADIILSTNITEFAVTSSTSFALIAAAEIGDKSQLVCMVLASRYKPIPVLWGAVLAFLLLNSLAVIFGQAIALWLPEYMVSGCVALLFFGFGIHAIRHSEQTEDLDTVINKSDHSIVFSTFLLITLAEFGDKTQLAVVALSTSHSAFAVWLGSTLALIFTSLLGILAGKNLLKKIPIHLLHKASGIIFLLLAVVAGYKTYQQLSPMLDLT